MAKIAGRSGDVSEALGAGSDRLLHLMERRLGRLDPPGRELFNTVAFAESVTVEVICTEGESPTVDRLRASGLLREAGGRLEVAHPLLALWHAMLSPANRGVVSSTGF